jgi:hypothetical protein
VECWGHRSQDMVVVYGEVFVDGAVGVMWWKGIRIAL